MPEIAAIGDIGDDLAVASTLNSDRVQTVLAHLRDTGEAENEPAKRRVRAREAELGTSLYGGERAALGASAPLSIAPEVGQLLYSLTLAAQPSLIVEFGASLGCSTIYLASALHDLGAGSIITTELLDEKAQRAAANLGHAGLGDLVEIRVGDALGSLAYLDARAAACRASPASVSVTIRARRSAGSAVRVMRPSCSSSSSSPTRRVLS